MTARTRRTGYDAVKRCLDLIGAIIALIVSSPVLIVSAILIKLDGGPIFFVQERVGQHDRPFGMLKFRTMVANAHDLETRLAHEHANNGGYGVPGRYSDPRITRVGAVLRLLNLDELPQLVNIAMGEMSLVGPRPVPYAESLLYGEARDQVLSVKPGLTGYWQVKRDLSTHYDERIEMDSFYVKNRTLLLDARIVLLTPLSMLTSDYNSMTKSLPPPVDGILVSSRAMTMREVGASRSREASPTSVAD